MEDILSFNAGLLPQVEQCKVFDPAAGMNGTDDDDSDDEGIKTFQNAALVHVDTNRYDLPRTRSQSLEAVSTKPKNAHFQVGQLVYAHKGRTVPCWFPGVVEANTKKGFKVKFLGEFGVEDCVASNMMLFIDYTTRKEKDSSKFYEVPEKIRHSFTEAQKKILKLSKQ